MIKLSIITVVYNDRDGLMRTIASIDRTINQSSKKLLVEHVVIDGGSTDGTVQFIDSVKSTRPLLTFVISEPDHGIYDAMNKGVNYATGNATVFLNAGDEIDSRCNLDDVFRDLIKSMERPDEAGLVYTAVMKIGRQKIEISPRKVVRDNPRMPGIHQSMFYKRSVLATIPFDTKFKICGDYENFANVFNNYGNFRPINRYFSVFYAGGISSKMPLQLMRESYSVSIKYFQPRYYNKLLIIGRLIVSLVVMQTILYLERAFRRI